MTPSMYAHFVSVRDGALGFQGPIHDARADVEHGSFLGLGKKVVVENVVRAIGTIIETESQGIGLR